MSEYDLVVRGGTVVNASDIVKADVGVKGGRIVALGEKLGAGAKEVDASGRLVMPGGVDSHCHIDQPSSTGGRNAETFESATRSAACGGTTSVICFAPQQKGVGLADGVAAYHQRAKSACIDYSFHIVINDPNDAVVGEDLPKLIGEGHRSIKLFMTYASNRVDDGQILRILEVARRNQALVCVHAENHDAIMFMTEKLLAAGLNGTKYHSWCKPALVEREATYRMIALAELMDQPIQIFHVTCGEAAEEIRRAQQRGLKVFAETCPQYFVLTEKDLDRDAREGAKYLCSPAPRTEAEQEALWEYVRSGTLGNVTSDHAPYNINDPDGKFWAGDNAPFSRIANGVPGLETRMPIVFHEGVVKGRLSLQEFVAVTSTNAAKLFGLHPQKGAIAVGADADIVVWDAEKKTTITQDILHHATDYTPYEGMEVTGWPAATIARGSVLWQDGKDMCEPGFGKFLAREPYDYIKPRGEFPTPFDPVAGKVME
ncbi:MAG: dihydropyrimidinase [Nisaea sp.]|uniref:dihydropyrimidinase n=1 Tax=Nisaea sp. TaxID=2024842 RepID=UPI001AFF85E0|nr:dihydropyrimidinase [Nisaea sp.]MBO6561262.1 dihydropyrimidinase [Nisaea sp.]